MTAPSTCRIQVALDELADHQRAHVTGLRHESVRKLLLQGEIAGFDIPSSNIPRDRMDHDRGRHGEGPGAIVRRRDRRNALSPVSYRRESIRALKILRNHERIVGAHAATGDVVRVDRDTETRPYD